MNINKYQLAVFKKASFCRHFENEVFQRVKEKKINFPVYLSAGQEYVPASIAHIVFKENYKPLLFGQHRAHSIYLSFGGNINNLIDELLGKKTGCTFGMGGSLSIHSKKINMFGHDGFMGSNACIGVGACFASNKPTIVFMGDSTGDMLVNNEETLDGIFKYAPVPVITHCEDSPLIEKNLKEFQKKYGDDIPIEYHPIIRSEEACYKSSLKAVQLAKKHGTQLHLKS